MPPQEGAEGRAPDHATAVPRAPAQAPDRIMQKAAAHDLGRLVIAQRGSNPIANALFGAAAIAVMCGLIWGIAVLQWTFLRPVVILLVGGILVVSIMTVMSLMAGFTAAYLFEGGLIRTRNGVVSVARWEEIDRLLLWRAGGKTALHGKLLCYYVVTTDGRRLSIEAGQGERGDPLGEELQGMVARMGRPVVESGPAAGVMRPKDG